MVLGIIAKVFGSKRYIFLLFCWHLTCKFTNLETFLFTGTVLQGYDAWSRDVHMERRSSIWGERFHSQLVFILLPLSNLAAYKYPIVFTYLAGCSSALSGILWGTACPKYAKFHWQEQHSIWMICMYQTGSRINKKTT